MNDEKRGHLKTARFGFGPYDGVSADGWHVVRETPEGVESVAGPYCDRGVAERHLQEIKRRDVQR